MFKRIMVGLLGISVLVIVVAMLGTEANAGQVCTYPGGIKVCYPTTGTVICHLVARGVHIVQFFRCDVDPLEVSPAVSMIILCRNNGGLIVPGKNIFIGQSFSSTTNKIKIDQNGHATGDVIVSLLSNL